ncbi:MAG: hypothetical protein DRN04_17815 [Thermoprotei archaeon]|nr:MAG: hypothetical protein DRN04_17815 [Thermoprotei archaeon]
MKQYGETWASILLLIAAGFTGTLGFRLSIPVIAFLGRDVLQLSAFLVSFFYSGYMVSRALSSITLGYIVDRVPRVIYLVPLFATVFALTIYCYTHADNWVFIVLLRMVQGFLGGCIWPLVQYLVAQISPENLKGRILSVYFALGSVGILLSNVVYAMIVNYSLGYKLAISTSFFLTAALFMLIAIYLAKQKITHYKRGKTGVKISFERPVLYVVFSGFLLALCVAFAFGDIVYIYVSEVLSLTRSDTALLLAFCSGLSICFSYIISWFADKGYERETLALTYVLVFASIPLISIGNIYILPLGLTLALISIKAFHPLSRRYIALHCPMPATGIGAVNMATNLGISLGLIVFSRAYDYLENIKTTFLGFKINYAPYIFLLFAIPLIIFAIKLLTIKSK